MTHALVLPNHSNPIVAFIAQLLLDGSDCRGLIARIATACEGNRQRVEFLRRAAIIQHFALEMPLGNDIDWDAVLSNQALADRYRVEVVGSVVLPKFAFFELPQNYLALAMPPYSLDILNSESDLALCLLTGKVVTLYRLGTRIPWIAHHLRHVGREGNSVFLVLTGSRATSVFIGSASFVAFLPVRGFYLDACGDEDIGLKNGRLLNLSMDSSARSRNYSCRELGRTFWQRVCRSTTYRHQNRICYKMFV
jgi:hypothetical protein